MKFEAASLDILPLHPDHDRAAFDCGNQNLDRYIPQQARQDAARGVARVFVATSAENVSRILGCYALGATGIAPKDLPEDVERRLPWLPVPAALIGRLAVDRTVAGRGLGKILLADALLKSETASESLGVAALVVDPVDDAARAFYRAFGFRDALGSHNQMLLMRRVRKAV